MLESKVVSRESVDEVVRGCVEKLDGQRASFPQVYSETEVSQVVYEDRASSCSCMEEEVSSDGPFIYCDGFGKMCIRDSH